MLAASLKRAYARVDGSPAFAVGAAVAAGATFGTSSGLGVFAAACAAVLFVAIAQQALP